MHCRGHFGFALLLYAPISFAVALVGGVELAVVGGIAAAFLAIVPDIDEYVPAVAHRGPTHTVWFALLVTLGSGIAWGVLGAQAGVHELGRLSLFGAGIGTLAVGSHLLADVVTPMGIRPFLPFHAAHYSVGLVASADPTVNDLLLVSGMATFTVSTAAGVLAAILL